MQEQPLTPQESLALIGTMINRAKDRYSENGHLYLLWGWAVLLCSLSQFVLLTGVKWEHHYMVWSSMWVVYIYQVFYLRRKKRRETVRSWADDIIAAVWVTFVVLMALGGFLLSRSGGPEFYRLIYSLILALYGMPTVLSGVILRFRPLVYGGIGCWLLCVLSMFVPAQYQLLLIGAAVMAAWIIPGYLLRARYQKNADYAR